MQARVVQPFSGAPDVEVYARQFVEGDIVQGDLAAVAVREGWAKPVKTGKEKHAET